ncbi:unnamed protein product [Clonostachys rosea]|uniref:SnoaL-like domain-containing protein n=1 Tax=Bionectria ochroleuca TaxID=29856 RepID=A0ABY6UPV4_BIOOC|nr:unnamed protein product [Clonostachys rosea]
MFSGSNLIASSPGQAILNSLHENAKWTVTGSSLFAGTYHSKEEYHTKVLSKIHGKTGPGMTAKLCKVLADDQWAAVYFFTENAQGWDSFNFNMDYCWFLKVVGDQVVEVIAFPDSNKLIGLFSG